MAALLLNTQDLQLWDRGAQLIAGAHATGQYFSQAFARNFIAGPQRWGAIDFEDDPLEVMDLADAQARDWLMYLHSTAWLLASQHEELLRRWDMRVAREGAGVVNVIERAGHRMGWLRALPEKRKPWGRDVVYLQAAALFLSEWVQRL